MGAISDSLPDLWLKADAITGLADGAAVATWVDSSGNGRDATQGTAGAQPTYKVGALTATGKPVVRFDGNDYLNSTASASAPNQTVIAIVKPSGGFGAQPTVRGASAGGGLQCRYQSDGKLQQVKQSVANVGASTSSSSSATFEVACWRFSDGRFYDALASSEFVNTTTAASAVDGTTGNVWLAAAVPSVGSPQWLRLKPRVSTVATSVKIYSRSGRATLQARDFKIQGSNDGTSWTDLDTRTGVTWADAETKVFSFSNSTAWTYYRVYCTATSGGGSDNLEIAEIALNTDVSPTTVAYSFFRNGVADGGSAISSLLPFTASTTQVGRNGNGSESLTGDIAVLLSWSRALTDAEVAAVSAELNAGYLAATPSYTTTGTSPVSVGSSSASSTALVATGAAPISVWSDGLTVSVAGATGMAPVTLGSSSNSSLIGIVPITTGTAPIAVGSGSSTALIVPTTTGGSPVSVESGSSTAVVLVATGQAPVTVASASRTYTIGAPLAGAPLEVGVTVEVGPLTLLNLVTLPGVEVPVGVGLDTGNSSAVVPLPGVTVAVGMSLDARPVELRVTDPRHKRTQWRYVVTDLANKPLGELVDIQHDPVADGINTPTTMRFTMAADDPMRALIEDGEPLTRKCQVWAGNELLLWGPLLPDQQSDNGTAGYTVHDPSWWWRGGRRVIGRLPRKNLLRNGDFRQGLTYWSRGYDVDSIPKAAPDVRVVTEDFLNDTDGLDPIRAAEIVGVESVTQAELSSNAVFWPNLATFRPGGKAAIEAVANAMPTTTGLKVSVVGHTANDGTGNGLGLSARRAEAAKAVILTKRPHAVITTKGVGYYDPKPGFPIDSQEQRRVVISYDQTISGKSKQWMRQTLEVTQPKSAAYGLELTAAAMLKVADDWSVEDANMMSVRLVARRKSTPKKIWDESSASISDTDPVGRWIGQSTSITIPADDRPYLVDVYLYAPAALARYTAVGLFPEEELFFWGADQALIFKGIVEHIQDTSMGHGDLGIETRTPLTGIKRDRTYPFREHMPADTALEEFGGLNRGMDYDTIMRPDGRVILATFYPQQGKHTPYVLAQGSNVANASPERSRDVASSIIMQAQDLGSYRAETYAKDKRALGGLLLERVVTAEQGTPLNELSEAARQELAWGRLSTTGYWLDIDPDAIDDVLANTRKGDVVRLILDAPLPVDALARIVNRERHPDSLRLLVALDQEA